MKGIFWSLCLLFLHTGTLAQVRTDLRSPDGQIYIRLLLEDGRAFYEVHAYGEQLVKPSSLGFRFKDQPDFGAGLAIGAVRRRRADETWQQPFGTASRIRNHYHEVAVTLLEKRPPGRRMILLLRAYNDGVAFRFVFPKGFASDSLLIREENTVFSFPQDHKAWWIPADEFAIESLYRNTPLSEIPDANTPITIETASGHFISLHEAALLDYSEMTLRRHPQLPHSFIAALWPEPDGVCARIKLPFHSPWRSLTIARKPGGLVESQLIPNLNAPSRIKDVSWIQTMKFTGIWWGMHTGKYTWYEGPRHGATTERMQQYIDFSAKHGLGGVLAEGWNKGWETWATDGKNVQDFTTPYPDFDLEEVVRYARSKGVAFVAHHETGANIPEYERQLDTAFALLRTLGIRALKTGYAGSVTPEGYHHRGQFMIRHFQKVVETAAGHQVALDVHEGPKPTGLERTWPNLMSTEAIRGNEWNGTYRATPPYHTAILPYTRFLAGPADYTPGIFRINHTPESNKRLYCTLAHQLAMYVLFFSPMQMVSDMVEHYEGHPAFQFIQDVPVVWDETRGLNAELGKYACIARRSGSDWYIGAAGNEEAHLLQIPLDFLMPGRTYAITIYSDSLTTDWENNPEAVQIGAYLGAYGDTLQAALSNSGGIAVRISPSDDALPLPPLRLYNDQTTEKMEAYARLKSFGDSRVNHSAQGKAVQLTYPYNPRYPASGPQALTDGLRGSYNFSAGNWQGFYGNDLEAVVDLGEVRDIRRISIGLLNAPNDWIFLPEQVEFFVSDNGVDFENLGVETFNNVQPDNPAIIQIRDFSVAPSAVRGRYVRIRAKNIGVCPDWHYGRGQKAWMFTDEIIVE